MTIPAISTVELGGPPDAPLLLVGPSLGTSVTALWSAAATRLAHTHRVIGFDLPGHGCSAVPEQPFSIAEIAAAAHAAALTRGVDRYHYAGVSAGGAVGLELLLGHSDSIISAALICTGAKIRSRESWHERARLVRDGGTVVLRESAPRTWFSEGFAERAPETAAALVQSLLETDAEGYAGTCAALAEFDVRNRLGTISGTVVAIAGGQDVATPPDSLRYLSDHIPGCRYRELTAAAHLAPAEQPDLIAEELLAHNLRSLL